MKRYSLNGQRLAANFLLGCVLLNYPNHHHFNTRGDVFGLPVILAFLFGTLAPIRAVMALTTHRGRA